MIESRGNTLRLLAGSLLTARVGDGAARKGKLFVGDKRGDAGWHERLDGTSPIDWFPGRPMEHPTAPPSRGFEIGCRV